jgi:dienelactone hydrolase
MKKTRTAAKKSTGVAPELPSHGYVITRPVPGSDIPADYTFLLTRDEIYLPVAVRRPKGKGPFPVITMGRGNGKGGLPWVESQVSRLASMQDHMIERGYAVAFLNYRNEIPYLYGESQRARNLVDDMSGGENRTLKSAPTLDSDDLIAAWNYLKTLPYIDGEAIGAIGVSHSGELILKATAETTIAAGVVIEGASHEFLSVDTGPRAPRKDNELQYHDIEVARKNADKARAMNRIRRIRTPILHMGRKHDHLQGIFELAHEWMKEAGKESTWVSFDHPVHGYPYIYHRPNGSYRPDAVQKKAFERFMDYFDQQLKNKAKGTRHKAQGRKK